MMELHAMGGPFMWPLTALGLGILGLAVRAAARVFGGAAPTAGVRREIGAIVHLGGFCLAFGVLGQALGLYEAFTVIEQMGGIPPAMLAGGLKVSMITTLYGLILFLLSGVLWFVLRWRYHLRTEGA
ncbi:MAG: MotA/TolQ/ExbB proton channel family protein [Rhodothermales bacterium]|nr:MotA/TolQ/ExbB proton channel family protein [Rhodothermales bacterium]